MTAYYNEHDPKAAAWLRELIKAGLIADGIVDERSIEDVTPDELAEYTQCHFFAGIGGWSLALRLAGWPDDKPVWTGSCPCQPFSAAGKGAGFADERHLWPAFHYLIEQCRPPVVFGEQVASKDGLAWLDLVQADMEGTGYAVGAADLCAAGVGAPHIRQRLWFVGHAVEQGLEGHGRDGDHGDESGRIDAQPGGSTAQAGATGRLADADSGQCDGLSVIRGVECDGQDAGRAQGCCVSESYGDDGRLADSERRPAERRGYDLGNETGGTEGEAQERQWIRAESRAGIATGRLADSEREHRGERLGLACDGRADNPEQDGVGGVIDATPASSPTNGLWRDADWLFCRDGKFRPVEPGTFPLADGVSGRVGLLRGYGNAIVPEVAAEVILAYMEG